MGIAPEAAIERRQLLMHHRVVRDRGVELFHLLLIRQFAVQQQIADLKEARLLGELIDGIAAIKKNAFVAVDEGDVAFATRRRGETGIVGEDVRIAIELADVHDIRAFSAGKHGKLVGFVFVCKRRAAREFCLALSHRSLL
jgi:hypothetical protein